MQSSNPESLRRELEDRMEQLKQMRDEIRVHLHLGGMELKEKWHQLESHLREAEKISQVVTEASKGALSDLAHRAREVRDSLMALKEQQRLAKH